MVSGTLTAPTLEQLQDLVDKYSNRYHPAGYGTYFYYYKDGGKIYLTQNGYRSIVNDASVDEDGLFSVEFSRGSSCD